MNRASQINEFINNSIEKVAESLFSYSCIDELIMLDDELYEKAFSILTNNDNITSLDLVLQIVEDEEKEKIAQELFNDGYSEFDVEALIDIDEDEREEIINLMQQYSVSAYTAKELAELDEENLNKALALIKYTGKIDDSILELPDEIFNRYIKVMEENPSLLEESFIHLHLEDDIEKAEEIISQKKLKWAKFSEAVRNTEEYQQLTKEDIFFLKDNMFDNDFYTPEEYFFKFVRLKKLKTINDENILGCESFAKKIKENGLGDYAARSENMIYKNIAAILSIDPTSEKAKYLELILKLIKDGKVNSSALRTLSTINDLKSLTDIFIGFNYSSKNENSTWDISNNLKDDLNMVFGESVNSQNWIDQYIPTYKNTEEGIKNLKIGDAYTVDGEKHIKIKIADNASQDVKLTKETYAKLFPPVERFMSTQQIMGNCYCIETLMSMYSNDNMRIKLLELMEEDENGNVKIKFKDYKPVIFKDCKLPISENMAIYSSGANGYKLFEYAYSCALVEDKIKEAENNLNQRDLAKFKEFIELNPNDFYIYNENGKIKWMKYSDFKKEKPNSSRLLAKNSYTSFNSYLLGNGGIQSDVYKKFNCESTLYLDINGIFGNRQSKKTYKKMFKQQGIIVDNISTLEKAKRLIKSKDFLKRNQVQVGLGMHAYNLTQEVDNNGEISYYLYNPHNQGFPIRFARLEDLFSKVSQLTIFEM